VNISIWLQYDYNDANITTGSVYINNQLLTYETNSYGWGNWTAEFSNTTVSFVNWTTVTTGGDDTYGITNVNQNSKSVSVIWDAFVYDIRTSDGISDLSNNTNIWVNITYAWDGDNFTGSDGSLYLNGSAMTYASGNGWYRTVTQASVSRYAYLITSITDNQYGITVFSPGINFGDGDSTNSYVVFNTNNSIDTNNFTLSIWFWPETGSLDSGEYFSLVSQNGTGFDAGGTHLWKWQIFLWHNTTHRIVQFLGRSSVQITVTVVDNFDTNGVFDEWNHLILTLYTINNDTYYNCWLNGVQESDDLYDPAAWYTSYANYGNVTEMYIGISLTSGGVLTTGQFYGYMRDVRLYDVVFTDAQCYEAFCGQYPNETLLFNMANYGYNISAQATFFLIDHSTYRWNGYNQTSFDGLGVNASDTIPWVYAIWDNIDVTVAINMTWTICTYYVNVSFTGVYEYTGFAWVGNATIANSSLTITNITHWEELTKTSVLNDTFYVTDMEDTTWFALDGFTTNIVWCVWDNISSTYIDYYTEVTPIIKILHIGFDQLYFQYNSSPIGANWDCYNYRNGTPISVAVTASGSILSPRWQEIIVPMSWSGVAYTNNATKTINGRDYDFRWYALEVEIEAQLIIRNLLQEVLDDGVSVSGTFNTNISYLVYNENLLNITGQLNVSSEGTEEGFQIPFIKILTIGQHNFSIHFIADNGAGDQWFNQTYQILFGIDIEIPEQKNLYMEIKGISTLNCEWYVYNRDASVWEVEKGTILGGNNYFQFLFLLETTAGLHNYSLYFNISSTTFVWKNGSYQVDILYASSQITLYNSRGTGFDDSAYIVYVNGSRYFDNQFYNRTDYVYNITITDYFNDTILSNIYDFNRFIDIGLAFYTYKVYSEYDQFIYFNLTSSSGARYSQHLGPHEILSYYLVSGTYIYEYKIVNSDLVNYNEYVGASIVNQDTAYIISDVSLTEIYREIVNKIDSAASMRPIMSQLSDMKSSLGALQTSIWILAFILVGAMVFVGYTRGDEEILQADGTVKKRKKPQPSWLQKFSFGKGAANPKSQRVPKGTGRSTWTKGGVVFRDEMKDPRDNI